MVEGSWSGIGAAHFGAGPSRSSTSISGVRRRALLGGDLALEFLAVVDARVQALPFRGPCDVNRVITPLPSTNAICAPRVQLFRTRVEEETRIRSSRNFPA